LRDLKCSRIEATLGGLSHFPPKGKPRVFFVDLVKGREQIITLYKKLLSIIVPMGYAEEKRGYTPHITVARNSRRVYVEDLSDFEFVVENSFTIDRLILYESRLNPDGALYYPVETVPFR
jgi:2'-5' RNA ligase